MLNDKIDLVIPFVNGNDPIWRESFNKHIQEYNPHHYDCSMSVRYDGEDILKYFFRSIDINAPWINQIHLLLSGSSQIPEWLDVNTVHIVYHEDFIPKEFLPTFNSSAIECFIQNIPGLSEKFIYANDDFILNEANEPDDYFSEDGRPRNNVVTSKYRNGAVLGASYMSTFINAAKLASHNTDINLIGFSCVQTPTHDLKSCVKSRFLKIYEDHEEILRNSISMFRSEKNINIYFFILYDILRNKYDKRETGYKYCSVKSEHIDEIEMALSDKDIKSLCLNDANDTTVEDKKEIQKLLENKFPIKCKYEK